MLLFFFLKKNIIYQIKNNLNIKIRRGRHNKRQNDYYIRPYYSKYSYSSNYNSHGNYNNYRNYNYDNYTIDKVLNITQIYMIKCSNRKITLEDENKIPKMT